jgi:hypothetical protein
MITPPRTVAAATDWMDALDRLKAAEEEVRLARAAVTAACTAYIAARDAEDPAACNPPAAVV